MLEKLKKPLFAGCLPIYRIPPPVIDPPPSNRDLAIFELTPSNRDLVREGGWRAEGVFERVGVARLGEGGCAGANGAVAGLSGHKINAPMNKKGLFPPKKHTPQ